MGDPARHQHAQGASRLTGTKAPSHANLRALATMFMSGYTFLVIEMHCVEHLGVKLLHLAGLLTAHQSGVTGKDCPNDCSDEDLLLSICQTKLLDPILTAFAGIDHPE